MTESFAPALPATPSGGTRVGRLVVISYHFPPDGEVGGLRWSGLTKYLGAMGWKCWVVTAAAPSAREAPGGVTVYSCPRLRTLNDVYRWMRRGRASQAVAGPSEPEASAPSEGVVEGWIGRLRLEAAMLLSVPDQGRGWILRASMRARRLVARVRPDAVVSSGPPHSAHLVAWLATRGMQTRWLVDLRDPWAGPVAEGWGSQPTYQSRLAKGLIDRLEQLTITSASGVLCTTPELARAVAARYPRVTVDWVSNGVDRELLPLSGTDAFPGLGVVYAGSMYAAHDLGPVLRALRLFLDRNPRAVEEGTKFRIAGSIEAPHHAVLQQEVHTLALAAHVEMLGVLPREAALQLVARSRLAVVLAQKLPHQVPAKIYESVAMAIPTVVICSADSAASSAARRLNARAVEPDDVQSIAQMMEDVWFGRAPRAPPDTPIDYRRLAAQAAQLLIPAAEPTVTHG